MELKEDEVFEILKTLEKDFGPRGFELYPFKLGWYNTCVQPVFHLQYDEDTLAMLVISKPSMFEQTFLPYLRESYHQENSGDPIDECMVTCLSSVRNLFPGFGVEIIHDFDLHPNRRPKMLMQTAAHVAGAAYFYQKKDLPGNVLSSKNIYGVCIHPKYGGWFAIRAVVLFSSATCPNLKKTFPKDIVATQEKKLELLKKYNYHWEDWEFRDIIPVSQKYSSAAIKYFSTLPKNRLQLIEELLCPEIDS